MCPSKERWGLGKELIRVKQFHKNSMEKLWSHPALHNSNLSRTSLASIQSHCPSCSAPHMVWRPAGSCPLQLCHPHRRRRHRQRRSPAHRSGYCLPKGKRAGSHLALHSPTQPQLAGACLPSYSKPWNPTSRPRSQGNQHPLGCHNKTCGYGN